MIIDYKLTYPSGTATAVLINGFHTTHGDATAKYVVLYFSHIIQPAESDKFQWLNSFCVIFTIGSKWMDSQNTLQSASSGASSSGFTQVEAIVGFHSFPLLD